MFARHRSGGERQAHRGCARLAQIGCGASCGQRTSHPEVPHSTGLYRAQERTFGDAAGYRGWPKRRFGRFGLRQLTAGLGANLWGYSSKLALVRFPAPCSLARTPVPDPWRAFGRNPARSGCHGERDTKLRRSRRVRFCRHPSRPRVEWPDLPGRGTRQRLSVRRQNLSVPHYHRKANHRHPLVRTTLFRSDAQAQGLT